MGKKYFGIPLHPSQNSYHQENIKQQMFAIMGNKGTLVGGNVN
jgi:hypothetical protein